MKILLVVMAFTFTFVCQRSVICQGSSPSVAAEQSTIKLDPPKLDKGIPLMQALSKRASIREISDATLSSQQLSEILWSADGVNRIDGKRTAPSAMHKYPVDIYAVLKGGVYLYSPDKHELTLIASGDYRKQAGMQDFVHIAPLNLIFVADLDRFKDMPVSENEMIKWAAVEVGCQVENVYLYCASEALAATVRASIDAAAFGKIINARASQRVICGQTIGHTAIEQLSPAIDK